MKHMQQRRRINLPFVTIIAEPPLVGRLCGGSVLGGLLCQPYLLCFYDPVLQVLGLL